MTRVVLLTQSDCAFCDAAKLVLADIARDHPLDVIVVDADSERGRELALEAGAPFAPVLFLDGRPFSYGRVSERKLRQHLRSRGAPGS